MFYALEVSGRDRPGITAALLCEVARRGLEVLDLSQSVVGRRLTLSVVTRSQALKNDLRAWAKPMGLELRSQVLPTSTRASRGQPWVVTMLGRGRIPSAALAACAQRLAQSRFNITEIRRLGSPPLDCLELRGLTPCGTTLPTTELRRGLLALAQEHLVDIAVQRDNALRWAKRLVALDMDSTLIQDEVIDVMADWHGVGPQVAALTELAMQGKINFRGALTRRVALLRGLPAAELPKIARSLRLTPGARPLLRSLHQLGCATAIISGGFDFAVRPLAEALGVQSFHCNRLEVRSGRLTGRVLGAIVDGQAKARFLSKLARQEGIAPAQTVAIGDGANDLPMLAVAGLGIAFNAKLRVRERADVSLGTRDLRAVLHLMGLRSDAIALLGKRA